MKETKKNVGRKLKYLIETKSTFCNNNNNNKNVLIIIPYYYHRIRRKKKTLLGKMY